MDFDLSADQRALQAAARELLDAAASPPQVRAALGAGPDTGLWAELVDQGWSSLLDPGGLGLGFVEAAVLAEEIGRHVAPAPFTATTVAYWTLAAAGRPEWAARLASGTTVGAVARSGELAVDGPAAEVVLVLAADGVYLHDRSAGRLAAEPAMDLTRTVGWAPDPLAGQRIAGPELAAAAGDRAAALHAAELLGASQRMLEAATDYARTRRQFGRPIGSFQAVKHRLADMLVDVEGMRSAVYYAAWALSVTPTGPPGGPAPDDAALAASTAKAWASEAAPRVLAGALQVHGGIGFTWDHDLHLYLKRVQLSATVFGDASWHRERIAGLLAGRLDAGQSLF